MNKPVLIVFATREGQTAKVAKCLEERFRTRGLDVLLVNARDAEALAGLELGSFALLIFGGSMHAGGVEKELVRFINRHATVIAEMQSAFFLVLLSAATRDPALREQWLADAETKVRKQLDVEFESIEMIAGALRYSRYPGPLKWLMQRIARQAGEGTDTTRDYEYTDWEQVRAFANSLVDSLSNGPSRPTTR